jgi:hypothetical protein
VDVQQTSRIYRRIETFQKAPGSERLARTRTIPYGLDRLVPGSTLRSSWTGELPVLDVGNVWPDGVRFDRLEDVLPEKAARLIRHSLKLGDLLFARSGATLGKVCLVPTDCAGWLMIGHLFRVRFDESGVINRFAFAALRRAHSIDEQVFGQARGATRPGYNTTVFGNVELPLPSFIARATPRRRRVGRPAGGSRRP